MWITKRYNVRVNVMANNKYPIITIGVVITGTQLADAVTREIARCIPILRKLVLRLKGRLDYDRASTLTPLAKEGQKPPDQSALVRVQCFSVDT